MGTQGALPCDSDPLWRGGCMSFAFVVLQSRLGPVPTVNKVPVEGSTDLA